MLTYQDIDRAIYRERLAIIASSPLRPILAELAETLDDFPAAHRIADRFNEARFVAFMTGLSDIGAGWCTNCRQVVGELPERYCVETTRHCSKLDSSYDEVSWDEAVTEIHRLCQRCHALYPNSFSCQFRDGYWWCGQGSRAWVPRRPQIFDFTEERLGWLSHTQTLELEANWGLLPKLGLSPSGVAGPCRVWVSTEQPLVTYYTADADDLRAVLVVPS